MIYHIRITRLTPSFRRGFPPPGPMGPMGPMGMGMGMPGMGMPGMGMGMPVSDVLFLLGLS